MKACGFLPGSDPGVITCRSKRGLRSIPSAAAPSRDECTVLSSEKRKYFLWFLLSGDRTGAEETLQCWCMKYTQACLGSQQHRQQAAQLPQSPPCSLQQLGPGFHSPERAKVTGSANDSSHPSPGCGAAIEQPPLSAQHQFCK